MEKANANVELSKLFIVGGIAVVGGLAVGATLFWDHIRNNGSLLAELKIPFSAFANFLFGNDKKTKVDNSNDQETSPKHNSSNHGSDETPQTDDQLRDDGSSQLDEGVNASLSSSSSSSLSSSSSSFSSASSSSSSSS